MKKVLLLLCVLAMTGIASADLLSNGDFTYGIGGVTGDENAPQDWSTWHSAGFWANRENLVSNYDEFGVIIDPARQPVYGDITNYHMAIGYYGGYGAGAFQDVTVADNGATYKLTADSGLDLWWLNSGYLKLEFYDAGATTKLGEVESTHWTQPDYDEGTPWANYSLIGTAPAGTEVVRAILGTWGEGGTARFDNAELTVVPEPATMALLGLGGLLLRRRK